MPEDTIESVLRKHTAELMSVHGVVGTAIGLYRGRPCLTVFVNYETPEIRQKVPRTLEGYTVRLEETGEFRALHE